MCIICYKPKNEAFPPKSTLQTMFKNNPDGAGYMYAVNNKIYIRKGFTSFNAFEASLNASRRKTGDAIPYVLHFRISTQAHGRADCTHPFPLSDKMADLRALKATCNIGIAHNGIIRLTSSGYSYSVTYSDTMLFITDYLSLIIKHKNFYLNKDIIALIDKLCDGKLAILDGNGHCTLIGTGWKRNGGLYYSNDSYEETIYTYTGGTYHAKPAAGKWSYTEEADGKYNYIFTPTKTPDDPAKDCDRYGYYYTCSHCTNCRDCYGGLIDETGSYTDDPEEADDGEILNADQTPEELADDISLVDLLELMKRAGICDDIRASNIAVYADHIRQSDPLAYEELYDQLRSVYDSYIDDNDRYPFKIDPPTLPDTEAIMPKTKARKGKK